MHVTMGVYWRAACVECARHAGVARCEECIGPCTAIQVGRLKALMKLCHQTPSDVIGPSWYRIGRLEVGRERGGRKGGMDVGMGASHTRARG